MTTIVSVIAAIAALTTLLLMSLSSVLPDLLDCFDPQDNRNSGDGMAALIAERYPQGHENEGPGPVFRTGSRKAGLASTTHPRLGST